MHFTFTDSAVECACLVFVLCIIGLFSFKLVDLWTDYKEYKEVGLKLDWVFAAQVILLLAMVFAVVYLVWINPITAVIFFYDKYLLTRLKFNNKKPRFILLRK